MPDIGRNDPCHCGSGKKYKKCHEAADQAKEIASNQKTWTEAEKKFAKEKAEAEKKAKEEGSTTVAEKSPKSHGTDAPSKGVSPKHTQFVTPKYNMPRKAGGGA